MNLKMAVTPNKRVAGHQAHRWVCVLTNSAVVDGWACLILEGHDMDIRKLILGAALVALAATDLFGQANWRGIQPGVSRSGDVERAAGAPVQALTDTLAEYKSTQPGDRAFVQYRATGVVERVEITFAVPLERAAALRTLGLSGNPEVTKPNARGKMEEYYGSAMMVLTVGDTASRATPTTAKTCSKPPAARSAHRRPRPLALRIPSPRWSVLPSARPA